MSRFVFILLLFTATFAEANLLVENPQRSHGYFIGDVLVQRVKVESSEGSLTASNFESDLRVSDFLYRMPQSSNTVTSNDWFELRYQIINSPLQASSIALPAVSFVSDAGVEHVLQPWPFMLSPLVSASEEDRSKPLPDRRALDVIEKPNKSLLYIFLGLLLSTIALWVLWWTVRYYNDSIRLPFQRAKAQIQSIRKSDRDSDETSWLALHQAFNQVAGKTISRESLPELFESAPWLTEFKGQIEHFYTASGQRFYQQVKTQPIAVAKLCRTLSRAEQQHAKKEALAPYTTVG